jgi:hypothetical protein
MLFATRTPGVEHAHAGSDEVGRIPRHDSETVMGCRRGDQDVGVADGISGLAAGLDDEAPLQHDVLGYRQRSALEHWAKSIVQPLPKLRTAPGVGDRFDAETDLGEGHLAQADGQVARKRAPTRPPPPYPVSAYPASMHLSRGGRGAERPSHRRLGRLVVLLETRQ